MKIFQFKIQLSYTNNPVVWRRVLVPGDITFNDLHLVIQAAFGWGNSHMYQFSLKGWGFKPCYQPLGRYSEYNEDVIDSEDTLISDVFKKARQKYTYIYDFGDNWTHEILLEKIPEEGLINPLCIDGQGACPPEDCGGVHGYYNMVDTINNPEHPDHYEMAEWMGIPEGKKWDVNAFDQQAANNRCVALASAD